MKIQAAICVFLVLCILAGHDASADEAPPPHNEAEYVGAYSLPFSFFLLAYNGQLLAQGDPNAATGIVGAIFGSVTAVSGIILLRDEEAGSGSIFTALGGVAVSFGAANIIWAVQRPHASKERALSVGPLVRADGLCTVYGIRICVGL